MNTSTGRLTRLLIGVVSSRSSSGLPHHDIERQVGDSAQTVFLSFAMTEPTHAARKHCPLPFHVFIPCLISRKCADVEVEFGLLLGDSIICVVAKPNDRLARVFGALRQYPDHAADIPRHISYKGCSFFRMKNPVSLLRPRDGTGSDVKFRREVIKTCPEKEKRRPIDPELGKVCNLANEFSKDHIYVVIKLPDGEYCLPSQCAVLLNGLLP